MIIYSRESRGALPCDLIGIVLQEPRFGARMPLLRLDEVFRHILIFAAGCRSYGLMVALPFLPISPAPLLPCAFSPVIPANEALSRPKGRSETRRTAAKPPDRRMVRGHILFLAQ